MSNEEHSVQLPAETAGKRKCSSVVDQNQIKKSLKKLKFKKKSHRLSLKQLCRTCELIPRTPKASEPDEAYMKCVGSYICKKN